MRKNFSQNKKLPLKTSLPVNKDAITLNSSGMYSNFQKSKTNNTNNNTSSQKSQLTEINLTSIGNVSYKIDSKDRDTAKSASNKGAYHIIERIFKYIKPKVSQDLYVDLKFFLSEELKNIDENGDPYSSNNLQNSFNSITEIINVNIKNSRNTKRIDTFESNQNPLKQINLQISSERKYDVKEKQGKISPKQLLNNKVALNKDLISSVIKNKHNKPINPPCSTTNKDSSGKIKYEIKTSLYNEFKAISKAKMKNHNTPQDKNSNSQNTANSIAKPTNKGSQLNMSDTKTPSNKIKVTNMVNINMSKITQTASKSKINLRIPNEISINLKDINDFKPVDIKGSAQHKISKNSSVSKKNTNANSEQTLSNNNSVKINLVNNNGNGSNGNAQIGYNKNNFNSNANSKDVLKEIKLNLDENLRPLLNFSYEHFFNKEPNESYSNKESLNEINLDHPSTEHK